MIVALLLGGPVLTLIVGAATSLFVGRTLQPVEAMRRRAAQITSRNLHTRLPVPDTGDEIAALAETMNTMLDRIESSSARSRRSSPARAVCTVSRSCCSTRWAATA